MTSETWAVALIYLGIASLIGYQIGHFRGMGLGCKLWKESFDWQTKLIHSLTNKIKELQAKQQPEEEELN
jgi:hypothetical protein